jgi:DNA-binding transcriptional ArsR family regulator
VDTHAETRTNLEDRTRLFAALGDPVRFAIVMGARQGERAVNEIAAQFPISRPAISKHLRLLKAAGILVERRSGRNRYLRLAPRALAECGEWLIDFSHGDLAKRGEPATKPRRADWAPYL